MLPERHQGVFLRPQLLPDDLRGAAFSQEPNQMGGLALEPADLGLDRIRAPALRGDQGSHVGLHPRGELRDEVRRHGGPELRHQGLLEPLAPVGRAVGAHGRAFRRRGAAAILEVLHGPERPPSPDPKQTRRWSPSTEQYSSRLGWSWCR